MTSLAYAPNATAEGGMEFRAFQDPLRLTGDLQAHRVDRNGAVLLWRAADLLAGMAADRRVIVTWTGGAGAPFAHELLDEAQRTVLDASDVRWLRGVGNNKRLGPIIGARPVVVGPPRAAGRDLAPFPLAVGDRYADFAKAFRNRSALVYVAANDGMLHAFDARAGAEVFAYVPNKLIDGGQRFATRPDQRLAAPERLHYLMDLTPSVEDVFILPKAGAGRKAWRTLLVGGLGRGGKGYFALDVTDPDAGFRNARQAAETVLWEFTDRDDAYPLQADGQPLADAEGARIRDAHGHPIKDLGYALSQARIGMSNAEDGDGGKEWVAVFGNGPDSTAGSATLFVLFLDRGLDGWQPGDFVKLSSVPPQAPGGPANGLGEPALVDLDLNGTLDRAYAGDLQGNLHRFDLSGKAPSAWSATAIFQARSAQDGAGPLPISARPQVVKHPDKPGFIVVFGTGGEAGADARAGVQSLFGIWDADDGEVRSVSKVRDSELIRQRMVNIRAPVGVPQRRLRVVSSNSVRYRLHAKDGVRGWRLDFDAPPSGSVLGAAEHPGERPHPSLLAWGDLLVATTILPGAGDGGAVLPLSLLTGGSPVLPVLDLNEDDELDEDDRVALNGRRYAPGVLFGAGDFAGPLLAPQLLPGLDGPPQLVLAGGQRRRAFGLSAPVAAVQGRLSWRELTEFD